MAHPPQETGLDRISTLPRNLFTRIFSYLPVKTICRARVLSKDIKLLIDVTMTAITLQTVRFHQHCLGTDHDLLTNTWGLPFGEVFKRFIGYYGVIKPFFTERDVLYRLILHHIKLRGTYATIVHGDNTFGELLETVDTVLKAPLPEPQRSGEPLETQYWFTRPFIVDPDEHYDQSLASQSLHRPSDSNMKGLAASLGNSWLTRHDYFDYCAGSRRAFDLITQACKEQEVVMTAFERAAILEDIFIW